MRFVDADDPVLKEAMPVLVPQPDGTFSDLRPAVREMLALMREGNGVDKGIGMAAPQVGLRLRMFVMDRPNAGVVCINPRVVMRSRDSTAQAEGCLSYPGRRVPVKRARQVTAEWTDLGGKLVRKHLVEFSARVFQHELDHLDGHCAVGV